ncbi:oligopeptidase B [Chitinophaga jiangningensis]|uniref:Proline-specific endopeptidase n=1 Tax=Chitinophaga jiangningensis TaxID=1419482 RepID=A0A1M7GEH0_9BACT|nr:S9 family peptidase [Chitinophaga jiangningensis]SHM14693.1 oligopeptidase B [Chitinophaga jiangningensis]
MSQEILTPPSVEKIAKELSIHGHTRTDHYYWLNNREDQKVIDYLKAENNYLEAVLAPEKELREQLFAEMKGRIKETDMGVPYRKNGYYYYSRFEQGKEYPIYCRKKGSLDNPEEIVLDVNILAAGHNYCQVSGLAISPDARLLAYGIDTVSRRKYTLRIKDLSTGELLPDEIKDTDASYTWAADNLTLFYTRKDPETLRSDKVMRHTLGVAEDVMVFYEGDETFNVGVSKTKSGKYIVIDSDSTQTGECRILAADDPNGTFRVFHPRTRDMLYSIDHRDDKFYIITNWKALNFRLMTASLESSSREEWEELIPHRADVLLEELELFNDFMVLNERSNGLNRIRVIHRAGGKDEYLQFTEPAYTVYTGANPEMDSHVLRYGYVSMVTPSSVYDYDMLTGEQQLMRQQEVLGGYNADEYTSERLMVPVTDGTLVPVSLVYRKDFVKDGTQPLLLYAYGSYGHSMDVHFSSTMLTLLNRGFAYAIAHIRGGEDMGRQWYEDGKMFKKKNTFTDFIDCGEYLVRERYTSAKQLYAMGGSAGGLLMGAIINMRPDLWNGVVAQVPFVDVVTTMLDETIPLTTGEFDEWGNPKNKESYDYMLSYSPYDNVEAKGYPNLLVTTGLHDSQVQYWEPAKWVAKLRELKTDNNLLLLHTDMETGHGGASGRFEALKEKAMEYAFLLKISGKEKLG